MGGSDALGEFRYAKIHDLEGTACFPDVLSGLDGFSRFNPWDLRPMLLPAVPIGTQ